MGRRGGRKGGQGGATREGARSAGVAAAAWTDTRPSGWSKKRASRRGEFFCAPEGGRFATPRAAKEVPTNGPEAPTVRWQFLRIKYLCALFQFYHLLAHDLCAGVQGARRRRSSRHGTAFTTIGWIVGQRPGTLTVGLAQRGGTTQPMLVQPPRRASAAHPPPPPRRPRRTRSLSPAVFLVVGGCAPARPTPPLPRQIIAVIVSMASAGAGLDQPPHAERRAGAPPAARHPWCV